MVKVSYPLKQGLKHSFIVSDEFTDIDVKVSYPLKQGLKNNNFFIRLFFCLEIK